MKKLEAADDSKQQLASYLILPVQRLPRYIMLLSELRKHTADTHADAPLLAQVSFFFFFF